MKREPFIWRGLEFVWLPRCGSQLEGYEAAASTIAFSVRASGSEWVANVSGSLTGMRLAVANSPQQALDRLVISVHSYLRNQQEILWSLPQ